MRKQKTDKRDAAHILKLLVEGRFPRLWMPTAEQRDLRQLLIHRHKLVEIRSAGEERTAAPGHESGDAEEAQAVERRRDRKLLRELPLEPAGRRAGARICWSC